MLSEQVTDECVGEDSFRVEFLADLIEAIVHWVESPCFFAAQSQMFAPVRPTTEFLQLALETLEEGARELFPEGVGPYVADIPSVGRAQHGLVGGHETHLHGEVDVVIVLLDDPTGEPHGLCRPFGRDSVLALRMLRGHRYVEDVIVRSNHFLPDPADLGAEPVDVVDYVDVHIQTW